MGNRTVRHPQHLKKIKRKKFNGKVSAGSRPSDKGGGGGGHPDPEIRGRGPVSKKYFWALRASFSSKNKVEGGGGASPGSSTVFLVTLNLVRRVLVMLVSP